MSERTEMAHSIPSSDVVTEVDGCGSAVYLVSQHGQLVVCLLMVSHRTC